MDFMRRVALLVVEDSFRYGWKSTRVQTHEELFLKLAALAALKPPHPPSPILRSISATKV